MHLKVILVTNEHQWIRPCKIPSHVSSKLVPISHDKCTSLWWCHNGYNGASNHQPHDYLLNPLFRRRSKKTSKLCVTGLCAGNSLGTGEFPAQMASNEENVSIWWCHHVTEWCHGKCDLSSCEFRVEFIEVIDSHGKNASLNYAMVKLSSPSEDCLSALQAVGDI